MLYVKSTPLPSGKKWFDCAECHAETENHPLMQTLDMTFICKKCKKAFRKNVSEFEEADEYCPICDNHFIIDAITPKAALKIESEDTRMDNRMLKDERVKDEEVGVGVGTAAGVGKGRGNVWEDKGGEGRLG